MSKAFPFCLLFIFSCFFLNCTEEPPPTLNSKDRDLVDSLYRVQVSEQKPIIDSICGATFDSLVQVAVDSIMLERLTEIENQLSRIRKTQ